MILRLFAFPDDTVPSRSSTTRERELQAYYDEHAEAARWFGALKWLAAALLVFAGFAAWATGSVYAREPYDHSKPAIALPQGNGAGRDAVKLQAVRR